MRGVLLLTPVAVIVIASVMYNVCEAGGWGSMARWWFCLGNTRGIQVLLFKVNSGLHPANHHKNHYVNLPARVSDHH